MPVISNPTRSGIVTVLATATETVDLSTLIVAGETLDHADIVGVAWSGTWVITRAGTPILSLSNTGNWLDLDSKGVSLKTNSTSNIVATLTGDGTLILRLKKSVGGYTFTY